MDEAWILLPDIYLENTKNIEGKKCSCIEEIRLLKSDSSYDTDFGLMPYGFSVASAFPSVTPE